MGGRGAYWSKIGSSAISSIKTNGTKLSNKIKIAPEQIGKKIGKHAQEFGLNPSNEDDRNKFVEITKDIIDNHDEKRKGTWRGQKGEVTFYAKGNDVVIVNSNGEYVTTMKDGVKNKKYQGAKKDDSNT